MTTTAYFERFELFIQSQGRTYLNLNDRDYRQYRQLFDELLEEERD